MTVTKKNEPAIPFADLHKHTGLFATTISAEQFCASVEAERDRLTVLAAADAYVAIPYVDTGRFGEMFITWGILLPEEPAFTDSIGRVCTRRPLQVAAGSYDNVRMGEEATKDFAAAMTLGRRARNAEPRITHLPEAEPLNTEVPRKPR